MKNYNINKVKSLTRGKDYKIVSYTDDKEIKEITNNDSFKCGELYQIKYKCFDKYLNEYDYCNSICFQNSFSNCQLIYIDFFERLFYQPGVNIETLFKIFKQLNINTTMFYVHIVEEYINNEVGINVIEEIKKYFHIISKVENVKTFESTQTHLLLLNPLVEDKYFEHTKYD